MNIMTTQAFTALIEANSAFLVSCLNPHNTILARGPFRGRGLAGEINYIRNKNQTDSAKRAEYHQLAERIPQEVRTEICRRVTEYEYNYETVDMLLGHVDSPVIRTGIERELEGIIHPMTGAAIELYNAALVHRDQANNVYSIQDTDQLARALCDIPAELTRPQLKRIRAMCLITADDIVRGQISGAVSASVIMQEFSQSGRPWNSLTGEMPAGSNVTGCWIAYRGGEYMRGFLWNHITVAVRTWDPDTEGVLVQTTSKTYASREKMSHAVIIAWMST